MRSPRRRTRRALPLPHVPEGERRAVHGLRRRAGSGRHLDARHALDLREFDRGARGFLLRLRNTADLQMADRMPSASRSARSIDPAAIVPVESNGIEALLPWSEHIADLPKSETSAMPADFVNHQHPDHDT